MLFFALLEVTLLGYQTGDAEMALDASSWPGQLRQVGKEGGGDLGLRRPWGQQRLEGLVSKGSPAQEERSGDAGLLDGACWAFRRCCKGVWDEKECLV